tara:strand:+ start:4093 stop:5157 length:1065 start_codon:yes stop_codon:yes gene_type:complete
MEQLSLNTLLVILIILVVVSLFKESLKQWLSSFKKKDETKTDDAEIEEEPITVKDIYQVLLEVQKDEEKTKETLETLFQGFMNPVKQGEMGETLLEVILENSGIPEELYVTQESGEEGRPDMIISLPGQSKLVIDSKSVTNKYVEAFRQENKEEREGLLEENANNLEREARNLAKRKYDEIDGALSFVVMFVPWDAVYNDAVKRKPEFLIQAYSGFTRSGQKGTPIIIATPSSIAALLKIVNMMWRERNFYTNVEKVKLAVETIYEQLRAFNKDFIDTGDSFRKSSNKLRLAYGKYSRIFPSVKTIAENLKNTEIEITDEHDFMEDNKREKNLQDEDIQKLKSKLKEEEKPDNN